MDLSKYARPLVVVGVAFASLSAILIRISDAPPIAIAFYRMLFASMMLLPALAWYRGGPRESASPAGSAAAGDTRGGARDTGGGSSGGRSDLRSTALLVASGVFLALHFATWNASLSYTTVASSVVLVTLHPIFVAVGSIVFLKERVPAAAFVFIVCAIFGSALLSYGDFALGREALLGNALAVAGAVAVAGYMLLGRFLRRRIAATVYNTTVYSVAAAILLPMALFAGDPVAGYPLSEYLIFAALAFFCTILGHSIFNWALKYVPASSVSTSILLEPIFATLMAAALFDEIPGVLAIAGGTIVVVSLYLVIRIDSRSRRPVRAGSPPAAVPTPGRRGSAS